MSLDAVAMSQVLRFFAAQQLAKVLCSQFTGSQTMIEQIEPTFWKEGGAHAFVRLRQGFFRLFAVIREGNRIYADSTEVPTFSVEELLDIAVEIGIGNDREVDPSDYDEQSDMDPPRTTLLCEEHRMMADWLVNRGRKPNPAQTRSFEQLSSKFDDDGGDLLAGEREVLRLLATGRAEEFCIGTKQLCYEPNTERYLFLGETDEWTAEELLLFAMLILSDESICEKFEDQDSSFLVADFRNHRRQFSETEREILARLDRGEDLKQRAKQTVPPVHVAKIAPPVTSGIEGSLFAIVALAGEDASPTAQALATGIPEARREFTQLLVRNSLCE